MSVEEAHAAALQDGDREAAIAAEQQLVEQLERLEDFESAPATEMAGRLRYLQARRLHVIDSDLIGALQAGEEAVMCYESLESSAALPRARRRLVLILKDLGLYERARDESARERAEWAEVEGPRSYNCLWASLMCAEAMLHCRQLDLALSLIETTFETIERVWPEDFALRSYARQLRWGVAAELEQDAELVAARKADYESFSPERHEQLMAEVEQAEQARRDADVDAPALSPSDPRAFLAEHRRLLGDQRRKDAEALELLAAQWAEQDGHELSLWRAVFYGTRARREMAEGHPVPALSGINECIGILSKFEPSGYLLDSFDVAAAIAQELGLAGLVLVARERQVDVAEIITGADSIETLTAQLAHAQALAELHESAEAARLLHRTLARLRHHHPEATEELAQGTAALAEVLANVPGREDEAETLANRSHDPDALRAAALAAAQAELDALVGLDDIKEQVRKLVAFLAVQRERERHGSAPATRSHHLVFTGAPGTGKTTVARIMGKFFYGLGILPTDHVLEVSRGDLVGEHIGETAIKTGDVIDRAMDGVLFIDEAYMLAGEGKDFGAEAVATLLKRMEDDRHRLVVIVAGYEKEMERFVDSNPGLFSRFTDTFRFPAYTGQQLFSILELMVAEQGYRLSDAAKVEGRRLCGEMAGSTASQFGHAREIRHVIDEAIVRHAARIYTPGEALDVHALSVLEPEDLAWGRRPSERRPLGFAR